jgi:ubiquinone/menaquinone biosynthesis C-methylase UbiE
MEAVILTPPSRQAVQPCNLTRADKSTGQARGGNAYAGMLPTASRTASVPGRHWVDQSESTSKDARMAQVQSLEAELLDATTWTVALQPRRLNGRVTFEFSNGQVRSARHQQLDGAETVYNYPFSGRSPATEANARQFVAQYGADFMMAQLERNQFVRFRTEFVFDRLAGMARDRNYRILDFGCGTGHSLDALLDRFPNASLVGADIASQDLDMLRSWLPDVDRARIELIEIQDPAKLDQLDGSFDLINLNAVFEHLLPAERRTLLPELWRKLASNGRLVLTETPWRWFPIETHTTSRPLVNYLPDWLALAVTRRSGLYGPDLTWTRALRDGVRGATVAEIIACIDAPAGTMQFATSDQPDARDLLEVWWWGESRHTRQKALAYRGLSWVRRLTGVVVSPWINVVFRKTSGA